MNSARRKITLYTTTRSVRAGYATDLTLTHACCRIISYRTLTLLRFALLVLDLEGALILGNEGLESVAVQPLVALLLGGAELLHDGALPLARLEVARVAGELHPLILAVFVRLDERRPLHHAPEFAPPRGLKRERGKGKVSWDF